MAYRKTRKAKEFEAKRRVKEEKRLESEAPDYPMELPELRKQILITNYDFEKEVHLFELFKSERIDQYKVLVDGKLWNNRIGLSGILAGIRKSMPPVRAV